ncbi:hypothetical protein BU61_592 [Pontoporia blainvillei]|uniref:Prolactin receptor n=1 Tax=Pontoporia blainvillei TaxID=48723 RepID=A0ABX0S089_PONBL|nr:hypothetical protein [Pontoporia blainvillei]
MGDQCLVPAHEACQTQGEDKCPTGPVSEPKIQEERLKLEEERHKPEVQALEERGPRPIASIVRTSHGLKRKPVNLPGPSHQAHPMAEAELLQGMPLQREKRESSQSEPSLSAKQHKKAKKRKSVGTPVLPVVASTVSTPSETLGLERELGSGLTLPCPNMFMTPTYTLVPLGEEAGEEPGGLPSLGVSGCLKAEMLKSAQVDTNKMLSVCTAPLVPPPSPQYE